MMPFRPFSFYWFGRPAGCLGPVRWPGGSMPRPFESRTMRRGEGRRRKREAARPLPSTAPDDLTWREVREVLDAEIAGLPEHYRLPVVLCYLQELTHEEAARRAGCSVGAVRGRLERGKERLRKRLVRYGLPLAAPALVVGAPPPVSAALVARTVEVVVGGANAVSPALSRLLTATGRFRSALLLAPAAAMLAAIGVVLAASGGPATDPPKAEPPRPANSAAIAPPRTDRFGDPLPEGVLMRLGTTRSRASIAGLGVLRTERS